jgi:two-component system cell cycle sensor histidine kinase/response regulator CckA
MGTACRPESDPAGAGQVLLVEDDTVVRAVISRVLGSAGYSVIQAVSVESALAMLDQLQGRVSLVMSDVWLHGRSGHDLARAVRERWPELPLCLLSGRPDRRRLPRYEVDRGYVEKPPMVPELLAEVRRLIERQARRASS